MYYEIHKNNTGTLDAYEYYIQIGRRPTSFMTALATKSANNMIEFLEARLWFSKKYGYGEKLFPQGGESVNEYWCWSIEYTSYRIFVKSSKEALFFKLAHPQS